MGICLIGKNLTTLVLAKTLVNEGILVDLYDDKKISKKLDKSVSRTIGLSNDSINFLENQKIILKKNCWDIKQINLYKNEEPKSFLNFKSEKKNFFITPYNALYKSLDLKLKRNKFINFKKILNKNFYEKLYNKNYEIIIITDTKNYLFKKYFSKRIQKNYNSTAFTTIITHSKLSNKIAEQYFTSFGPLAFLPISNYKTSIVFSIYDKDLISNKTKIKKLIKHYNQNYEIKNMLELQEFPINLSLSRNYYHKNVLSFGDALHKIHPLAGQGFNMTLRDTQVLSQLIKNNKDLGLSLNTVLEQFEKKRKDSNYIFAFGIDFIHEFFKLSNNYNLKSVDKFFKLINKNVFIKNKIEYFANKGINF